MKDQQYGLPLAIGVGIALGAGIGVALDNVALGIGIGIALGAGLFGGWSAIDRSGRGDGGAAGGPS